MAKLVIALIGLLAGCRDTPASEAPATSGTTKRTSAALDSSPPGAPQVGSSAQATGDTGDHNGNARHTAARSSPPAASAFYSLEDLATLGLNAKRLGSGDILLCGAQCVCLKPLDCSGGDCVSYDENIATFRAALKAPGRKRSVSCRHAEAGRCGKFRYFNFEGDSHRRELRWFDETGAMVAQRNVADYDAYCENQTSTLFVGSVPRCDEVANRDAICGRDERGALTALEDLQRFTAAPAHAQ